MKQNHVTLANVPLEMLLEEVGRRVHEMVFAVRVRPNIVTPQNGPKVLTGGKGDAADRLGLCRLLEHLTLHPIAEPNGDRGI